MVFKNCSRTVLFEEIRGGRGEEYWREGGHDRIRLAGNPVIDDSQLAYDEAQQ